MVCLLLAARFATAVETVRVEFVVHVPPGTPADATVCLAGNLAELGAWRAAGLKLDRQNDSSYQTILQLPEGTRVEYKVNQGSWETVEKTESGDELANRTFDVKGDQRVEITVARWASATPAAPKKSTITGNVRLLEDFESRTLNNRRPIWVYLPPGYDRDVNRRYPVLYMHDGQNVFDDATSFAGEWRADETAERLIAQDKIEPVIIVAVANDGPRRIAEYTPTPEPRLNEGGRAGDYARFLITELKPFIDRTYRTIPDRQHTAVLGSSLGGLVSLYIAQQYPEQVGLSGVVSPSLWWDSGRLLGEVEKDPAWTEHCRIWLDMGTAEGSELATTPPVEGARKLAGVLRAAGRVPGRDFTYLEVEKGEHNERAWAERFDQMLIFFFGQ